VVPRETRLDSNATALAGLRIFFGVVFLANGAAKLIPAIVHTPLGYLIGADGALAVLRAEVAQHPLAPYRDLMSSLVIDNWSVVAPGLAMFEVIVGILLIAGLWTRWAALAGAVFGLHLQFLTLFAGRWLFEHALIWVPLLVMAVTGAGSAIGLDSRRQRVGARPGRQAEPG
jgi:uncharacterized membrane protein YphA (DoxX/SURF4 family)